MNVSRQEAGVEDRHPFLDRRVVELMLSLPDHVRRRGPYTKAVLRTAMRDHLPASVAARRNKADFTHSDMRSLEALGGAAFIDHLRIAEAGWVDQGQISAAYRVAARHLAAGDRAYEEVSGVLWMAASVEIWFRTVIAGGEPVAPARERLVAKPA